MLEAILLDDRGSIEISGAHATVFLHNLVTNDVQSLRPGEARFAALLTPQGKIISDFLVFAQEDAGDGPRLLLDCPRSLVGALLHRFDRYRLRAKTTIVDKSDVYVSLAFLDESSPQGALLAFARDPRSPLMGWRAIALRGSIDPKGDRASYETRRVAAGVPDGLVDFAYGDAYPHETNMDRLAGIDFKKGCYVGQEIVSRMQHRGTVKKRVTPFRSESAAAPSPGSQILVGETEIGLTGSYWGSSGLALIRLDRLDEGRAAGLAAHAAGISLEFIR
jgi:folate-binding protein YgfZ